jgi:hypothetical protein
MTLNEFNRDGLPLDTEGVWVEVPAHRIYVTHIHNAHFGFEYLDSDGNVIAPGPSELAKLAMLRRKRDGKLFRPARLRPQWQNLVVSLEEV